jgi:signal peptidase I
MNQNAATAVDPESLRREAKRRCRFCFGGGFTSLGYPSVGVLYLSVSILAIAAWTAAILTLSQAATVVAGIVLCLAVVLYVVEVLAVRRLTVRALPVNRLRSAFVPIAVAQCALGLAVAALLFTTCGSLRMHGHGMSPTLKFGERLLYRKRVDPGDLTSDRVILFRLNPENTWSKQRTLVTARILAVPGDKIWQQNGHYVVDSQPTTQPLAPLGRYAPAIAVPEAREPLTVPDNCYFIVQDDPANSFDSQVLSWARREDIVSTDVRHFVKDAAFLKKVE